MGVGVSNWRLARAVSRCGQLGVVSGTALSVVVARRLQDGDAGGHLRRVWASFPCPRMVDRVLGRWFREGGRRPGERYRATPLPTREGPPELVELTVLANYAEVALARPESGGAVGINYLEKIQLPTLPSLYGAMLAGVDFVLVGAGIPRSIPGLLDRLAEGLPAALRLDVEGAAPGEVFEVAFDPAAFLARSAPRLPRPRFLAIVASASLATMLVRKASGRVDGFVVEGSVAGGHNAPPRGVLQLSEAGEPVYGERDRVDFEAFRALGLPFWVAGGFGRPDGVARATAVGAAGIQVGTPFAFCEESGIDPRLKARVLAACREGQARIFTDPRASPTGYPFKVVRLAETLSEEATYRDRRRVCDLGYLRVPYRREDGDVGYRCSAEPEAAFVAKGGDPGETAGRKCLCNGLLATLGLGQIRDAEVVEPPILTAGDDLARLARFLPAGSDTYSAADVVAGLMAPAVPASVPGQHPTLTWSDKVDYERFRASLNP